MGRRGPLLLASLVAVLTVTGLAFEARQSCTAQLVEIASSEEKAKLLAQLADQFNRQRPVAGDRCFRVDIIRKASGATEQALARGWDERADGPRPDAWSPAATTWIMLLNQKLADGGHPAMADQNSPSLFKSPLVIGMPRKMAAALGWPAQAIGWSDLLKLARDRTGWSTFGHPEWGRFQLGKTNPTISTSGLHALLSTYFAASSHTADLTAADLVTPAVVDFVRGVESSVVHYGDSVSEFLLNLQAADDRDQALSYVSAVALEEKQVLDYNRGNPTGDPAKYGKHLPPSVPMAAIYPKEGTLAADHPFAILNAPWVTDGKRSGARAFLQYLQSSAQQRQFQAAGFRDQRSVPGPVINLTNGLLANQPGAYQQLPLARVIVGAQTSWQALRKRARVLLVVDTSTSSDRAGLDQLQRSVEAGLEQLQPDDQLGMWVLPGAEGPLPYRVLADVNQLRVTQPAFQLAFTSLSPSRQPGNLMRVTQAAAASMAASADLTRINAIVVVSGGHSSSGDADLDTVLADLLARSGQIPGVHVFTVAYGSKPDLEVLNLLSMAGRGGTYDSATPSTIARALAAAISNF